MNEKRNKQYAEWAEAFTIFSKYDTEAYGHTASEHDEFYAGPDPDNVSKEDVDRLKRLGWTKYDGGCFRKIT